MTWTTPRTWADGEVVTASLLNSQIRDELIAIGAHAHADIPGATTLRPSVIDLAEQAGVISSDTPGRFQRVTGGLWYTRANGQNVFIGEDAAAATPATRSLGPGAAQAAAGTHRHGVNLQDGGARRRDAANSYLGVDGIQSAGTYISRTGTYRTLNIPAVAGERAYADCSLFIDSRSISTSDAEAELIAGGVVLAQTADTHFPIILRGIVQIPSGGLAVSARLKNSAGQDATDNIASVLAVSRVYVGAGV